MTAMRKMREKGNGQDGDGSPAEVDADVGFSLWVAVLGVESGMSEVVRMAVFHCLDLD